MDCEYGVESWIIKCGVQKIELGNTERKIKKYIMNNILLGKISKNRLPGATILKK